MEKKNWLKLFHEDTFKHNNRKYKVCVYSCIILPMLKDLKEHIVNNRGMLLLPKGLKEYIAYNGNVPISVEGRKKYIINNGSVSISVEDWKGYIAYNGSVPFILDELEEYIVDSDDLPFMPEGVRKYVIDNDNVLLMLDELRKYLFDNDMVLLMPEKRWEYSKEIERRNKEPEQYTINQLFKDTIVEGMLSKTTNMIIFLDVLIQEASETVPKNEEEEKFRELNIEVFNTYKKEFQYHPEYSYTLDCLGAEVVKLHAYVCGYEKLVEDSKGTKCVMQGARKCANKANEVLGAIYKSARLPWNADKHERKLTELYVRLVKRYGGVINDNILCFFYIIDGLDWKRVKREGEQSNIIGILFFEDAEPDKVPKNLHDIYTDCYGNSSKENDVYIKLYDLVEKVLEGNCLGSNATIDDIDICRKFLINMYVEIIFKIYQILKHKTNENTNVLIKKRAVPFFCNVLCSIREYERMKIISLMVHLTESMMINEDDGERGTVRSGCTDYFRCLYIFMVLNSETLNKNIMDLGNLKVADARKQCERALKKEFKGITIPEWQDDKKLSPATKRFNCMMLMACFIVCKQYQNPSDYSELLCWLKEIRVLYDHRMQDLHSTGYDWIGHIAARYFHLILCREYCNSIVYNFNRGLGEKKLNATNVLGNYIWGFQKKDIALKKLNKPINYEYWLEDGSPWIPAGNFNSKDELKRYLEDDLNLEIVPTVTFAEETACPDI